MATSWDITIPSVIFSSHLREIKINTDLEKVIFFLYEGDDMGSYIYETSVYCANGTAILYDIYSIITTYMQNKALSLLPLSVAVFSHNDTRTPLLTLHTNVVYSSHIMPSEAGSFASYNFLTTLTSKRTIPHSTEFLSIMHGQERNNMTAHCVFIDGSGNSVSSIVTLYDLGYDEIGIDTVLIQYDDILQKLTESGHVVNKLLAYTITWGNRTFSFYVHNIIPDVTFTFRNCFNVLETVSFSAVTTSKTKVDRSVAVVRSLYTFYDQTTTKEYEVQSSPLTMDEAQWIEQLFISHCVRFGVALDFGTLPIALINDSSCEISDSNADLNRVKFSWQFQDKFPHNLNASAPEDRIHQEQFTHQFT